RDENSDIVPDLRRADLSNANLAGANLSEARLMLAKLTQADLSHANLANAFLFGTKFTEARLLTTLKNADAVARRDRTSLAAYRSQRSVGPIMNPTIPCSTGVHSSLDPRDG